MNQNHSTLSEIFFGGKYFGQKIFLVEFYLEFFNIIAPCFGSILEQNDHSILKNYFWAYFCGVISENLIE